MLKTNENIDSLGGVFMTKNIKIHTFGVNNKIKTNSKKIKKWLSNYLN